MMDCFLNELSIIEQFTDCHHFRSELEPLLILRQEEQLFKQRFYCSKCLTTCKVTSEKNFQQIVLSLKDRNFNKLVLEWVGKSGPFWDDDRQENDDDYFECEHQDVTDQGLGEASRRSLIGACACSFSFLGNASNYSSTPLIVQHGLSEDPLGHIEVDNYWDRENLLADLNASGLKFSKWSEVDSAIRLMYKFLTIEKDAFEKISITPFSMGVTESILLRLNVLEQLATERGEDGQLSPRGVELLNKYFQGEKAWFTDESDKNKQKFENEMTFSDPEDNRKKIFCPWHGKIKTPQTRIHFEWPIPVGQKNVKVVYIGPKITKS